MSIQDLAGNSFITQSSPMIGFVEVDLTATRPLQLRIYEFLHDPIKVADQLQGNQFVERLLTGSQEVWNGIDRSIRALPKMWSITEVADRLLVYLKWIVGWTSELDSITDELDSAALRRLISASVPFWKVRGTENAMAELLTLTTGARLRIWNWFDLRWIVGETALGEELSGYDPWMLHLPGPTAYDEMQSNVRIVDDGTLNRRLVRNVVKLTRPSGERVTIDYIGFLDMFTTVGDDSQWEHNGVGTAVVADGKMTLSGGADIVAVTSDSDNWLNYTFTARVRGNGDLEFFRSADTDYYFVRIDIAANTLTIGKVLAGVESTIDQIELVFWFGLELQADLFYAIRVVVATEPPGTRIAVYFDGNDAFNLNDTTHVEGSIGFLSSSGAFEIDDIEMYFNPLTSDYIDINS